MYFDLTDEQKAISDMVAALLRDAIPEDKAVAFFERGTLDADLWSRVKELGLLGILVDEADGGLGMGLLTLAAVQEQLGYAGAAVPVAHNAVAAWALARLGTDAQKDKWLSRLLSGDIVAAFALDEGGGFGPAHWTLSGQQLSGSKDNVAWGSDASLFFVGVAGAGLGIVDRSDGVEVAAIEPTDRTQPLARVHFKGASCSPLGQPEDATRILDALYILLAADGCGAGNRSLQLAVDYAKQRKQFDRLIGSFQAIKHQLANMAAEMEPVRYLVWYAAHCWDTEALNRSYYASLVKAHAGEVSVRTARLAVEVHGGIGYTWEYPLHIYLKRAMFARTALGLPARHRERTAALAGW
jgi:alkylation response protein AidB-like acyl-CoA dehydrogenase